MLFLQLGVLFVNDLHIRIINLGFLLFPKLLNRLTNHLIFRRLVWDIAQFRRLGFSVDVIYDIGARHGHWSKYLSKWLKGAKFILFEANEDCKNKLDATNFQYFIVPLYSESGLNTFYAINGTGDSFFKEDSDFYRDIKPRTVLANTLDGIVALNKIPLPNFIKIDTQGSEIEILRGGIFTLSSVDFLYIEMSIIETNHGAPLISQYIEYLHDVGFTPYGIYEFHNSRFCLCQIDMLFISERVRLKLTNYQS
jgi:FkbM family methyltransferase